MSKNFQLCPSKSSGIPGDGRYRPTPAAPAQSAGYALGSAALSCSLSDARDKQSNINATFVALQKEKERQKKLKLLDEKIKRHAYLNTHPGNKLVEANAASISLEDTREIQHEKHAELVRQYQQSEKTQQPVPNEMVTSMPAIDNDRAMKEMRERQQQRYTLAKTKIDDM